MSGPVLTLAGTVMCPHGAPAITAPGSARVLAVGSPAVTLADVTTIAGCPFPPSGTPHPCVLGQWLAPATRVTSLGMPLVLAGPGGVGVAPDQAPQGPLIVVPGQPRVVAT